MPKPDLPADLRTAIEAEIAPDRAGLRAGTTALHDTYKAGGRSAEGMDFAAYLAARLPATYAAVARVLDYACEHVPDLAPRTMVDVGSGPGTAAWAATETFDGLADIRFLDNNRRFLDLALRLARKSGRSALALAQGVNADLGALATRADLVVAAYALAEMPESKAAALALSLWDKTDQALILVEPGTPAGFARLRLARTSLIGAGAAIAAPCPGHGTCPMQGKDWCHFSVRLPRSRAHMQAKGARVPFEDEPFCYLIAARTAVGRTVARVLSPTHHAKPGITLRLCTPAGVETRTVAKRDGLHFKRAKKAAWGDSWE